MSTLHKMDIGLMLDSHGVHTFAMSGEAIDVAGTRMVRMRNGTILPANGWTDDASEARILAAMRIEGLGRTLLAQAEQLRADAAEVAT